MEFTAGTTFSVPDERWADDEEAEQTALKRDLEYLVFAEQMGFKYATVAEHHFLDQYSHTSGTAVQLGYLAARTSKIHLLSGIFNPLPQVHHPVTVAENAAVLDLITGGRFEFGTGRGAGSYEILGFLPGIEEMNETKAIWEDVIGEFPKMWRQQTYEGHTSKYWSIPPRPILPKPYGNTHPPMWYAAGNMSSWGMAAKKGLGVIGFGIETIEVAEKAVRTYKQAIKEAEPIGDYVNDYLMAVCTASVSTNADEAFGWICSPQYGKYISLLTRYHDTMPRAAGVPAWPGIMSPPTRAEATGMRDYGACIGTPDDAIRTLKRWEAAGVDGLVIGVGHLGYDHAMRTMEMFGKYIIPEFDHDPEHRTKRFRDSANAKAIKSKPKAIKRIV